MQDLQREILTQVASGQITAAEAAARLEALDSAGPQPRPAERAAQATVQAGPETRSVRVTSRFGSAEIIGDPAVAYAVAEGPHSVRQDGDAMVIDHSLLSEDSGFSFTPGRRGLVNGLNAHRDGLVVRMNPDLALFAKVQAGNIRIDGMHGAIRGEVQAGNCSVNDFRGPLDLVVQAGELTARGRLETGSSKILCQMGEMKIRLMKGSSVRITARSNMGDIKIDGDQASSVVARSGREVTIGGGAATLEAECALGSITLTPE
jgi:hypothetical protein